MTGPAHYLAAEGILKDALKAAADGASDVSEYIAVAQVHATLALAAATALGGSDGQPAPDHAAWYRTASEGPGEKRRREACDAAELAEFAKEPQS